MNKQIETGTGVEQTDLNWYQCGTNRFELVLVWIEQTGTGTGAGQTRNVRYTALTKTRQKSYV